MYLSDIEIILCRVSDPGNAGAVCRVMKNMGLSKLRLVVPLPQDEELLRKRAVHAYDIWEKARVFGNLAEAGADCSFLVGTTRRRGRHRKAVSMDPRTLATWLGERPIPETGPVAIVFGNERTGLEDAELDLCNIASHIPVPGIQPSLNLSHAVQIYAYELYLALEPQTNVKGQWTAMNRAQVSELVSSLTDTLASLGFYKYPGREEQARFLVDLISRAGLSDREGRYLADIFSKAARLGSKRDEER
jgi:tRNA/rRNA methyltransferase/tRNA (cytidine32/uridine32-2'-O)-methyltransferase